MRIIPVLDVKQGHVVRGVAGRRAEYRPLVSRLTKSTDPVAVAQAIHGYFGLQTFYLADLDAIAGGPPSVAMYELLVKVGFELWVDAGLRTAREADHVVGAGVVGVVAGFESLSGPDVLRDLCARFRWEQVFFSLDLKDGRLFGPTKRWGTEDPARVARRAVASGVHRLIILDLARVGMDCGTGSETLCRELHVSFPGIEVIAGGGIRGRDDILQLAACGVQAVLVASALHDGRLTATDIAGLSEV